jgi:HPt (histidine-containing phosphotransfer) domain-containing protein
MSQISDLTFLRTFTAGDPPKMTKYINMFLNGAPQIMTQIRQQLEASDWKALKTSSHSLKTQLKYMGVASAVDLAFAIEQQCGDLKDLDKVPELVGQLEEKTSQAIAELREELTKL